MEKEEGKEEKGSAKCPPAQSVDSMQRKNRSTFRPVLLEVAGSLDDTVCQEITRRLRQYRNRYAPILRLTATLMAPAVQEVELFGHCEGVDVTYGRATNGKKGIAEGEETNGKSGSGSMVAKRLRGDSLIAAPCAAIMAERRIKVVSRLHENNDGMSAVEKLEAFMAYQFLPLALTHNCHPKLSLSEKSFILRHYVHEATRTSSFLIADIQEKTAAIIDPQLDISMYEADISAFRLRLCGVVLSHCFVDVVMGHAALLTKHPEAVLLSSTPWTQEVDVPTEGWPALSLSPRLQLHCVPVPSFSPECMLVELHYNSTLLALFTGTVIGTDSLPRHEFFADFPGLSPKSNVSSCEATTTATTVAQRFLKERLWDRYFAQTGEGNNGQTPEHVVVFPSHGGYNNVTHQLDLYWALHVGDLKRMKHSRNMLGKLLDHESYAAYVQERPPLPKAPLFSHVREYNLLLAPSAFGGSGARLVSRHSLPSCPLPRFNSVASAASSAMTPIVLDIRDTTDHQLAHLKGSVNIPMNFPATAYGVKKAELWLQCVLQPLQPIVVICRNEEEFPLVRKRLELLSPGAPIETYTAKELESFSSPLSATGAEVRVQGFIITKPIPESIVSSFLPRQLVWVSDSAASAFLRIDNYQQLQYLEPSEDTLVLDCRTSYEFKNGSHKHSVHIPLAELCQLTALDTMLSSSSLNGTNKQETPVVDFYTPSPRLGQKILEKLHESFMAENVRRRFSFQGIKNIIVYCASGYRSIIAGSLLRRAFETATVPIQVRDVVGGALQIMKQRPDLWTVKDRSIICVS
ncbi:beta-lactamase domain-containing protein [Trypanosoma cruzi]|uniref:Rhodanese domain-containing protein n=1 Tax=Trypanosoma cruzi TaxID=5693 RepID=A0A2V2VHU6_TRYCR|nr:hypothetical protein BCY84_03337 [Trypanosoma cruzi cruzi]PWU95881.1 hypothetical protein C4B63_20g348 [Trypanosoma cruzi]RNF17585.1 beta-lactamase domain-containing protein [Trypanosoma cruzi]